MDEYNNLALRPEFAAAGYVFHPAIGSWHTGTLVAPNWVLTSAHAFDPDATGRVTRDIQGVLFGLDRTVLAGDTYSVAEVILNPAWPTMAAQHDLALLRLEQAVTTVPPATIGAFNPLGQRGISIGYGLQSDGLGNPLDGANDRLATENMLDYVGPEDGYLLAFLGLPPSAADEIGISIRADFDSPLSNRSTYGSDTPLPLEGSVDTGDSGGPLFVQREGQWYLTGVLFGSFHPFQDDGYGNVAMWTPLFTPENQTFLRSEGIPVQEFPPLNPVPAPAAAALALVALVTLRLRSTATGRGNRNPDIETQTSKPSQLKS